MTACRAWVWVPRVALVEKNPPPNEGDIRDAGSIPGSGRFHGAGDGNPLQYSYLENFMDRRAWWATVHRVAKSQTRLKQLSTHAQSPTLTPCKPDLSFPSPLWCWLCHMQNKLFWNCRWPKGELIEESRLPAQSSAVQEILRDIPGPPATPMVPGRGASSWTFS